MKFLIVFAVIAVASAIPLNRISASEIEEIINAINSPSTNPATAAALEQMLHDLLGGHGLDDISVGPAIIEEHEDISVGPAIIEEHDDISVGPALIEEHEDISVGPAVIDEPTNPNFKGPLVQVIVNVDGAVSVDQVYNPESPVIPDNVDIIENEIIPDPILVVDNQKPELEAENINIGTPLIPDTAAHLPEDLN